MACRCRHRWSPELRGCQRHAPPRTEVRRGDAGRCCDGPVGCVKVGGAPSRRICRRRRCTDACPPSRLHGAASYGPPTGRRCPRAVSVSSPPRHAPHPRASVGGYR